MSKGKLYIGGDMLKKGSQIVRRFEREAFEGAGFEVFNPMDCKDINDKSKNPTSEAIFAKDTNAIMNSEIVVFDADNTSVGTTTEIGQVWGMNMMHSCLDDFIRCNPKATLEDYKDYLNKYIPRKKVYWHNTDIRHTFTPEVGMRRTFSMNAYLHGCLIDLSGYDQPMAIENIMKELKNIED